VSNVFSFSNHHQQQHARHHDANNANNANNDAVAARVHVSLTSRNRSIKNERMHVSNLCACLPGTPYHTFDAPE
jgi:hypothetical protein